MCLLNDQFYVKWDVKPLLRDSVSQSVAAVAVVVVQGWPVSVLRNRLILLHHFSELFCPCIPMFDLDPPLPSVTGTAVASSQSDLLRALLVSSAKVT